MKYENSIRNGVANNAQLPDDINLVERGYTGKTLKFCFKSHCNCRFQGVPGCPFYLLYFVMILLLGCQYLRAQDNQHLYDSVMIIISDEKINFDEKDRAAYAVMDSLPLNSRIVLLQKLVHLSKTSDDRISKTIALYSDIILMYAYLEDFDHARLYADTTLQYENRADELTLARLYYVIGNLYGKQVLTKQAHEFYYKSLGYFEKAGGNQQAQIDILYNLAVAYVFQKDTINAKKILGKMLPLVQQAGDIVSQVYFYTIAGSYYEILYDNRKEETQFRDSVLLYDTQIIHIYESITNPPITYGYQISYNYLRWATYAMELPGADMDIIKERIEKAKRIANPDQPEFVISYRLNLALYYLKVKNYYEAVKEAEGMLKLLNQFDKPDYNSYVIVYETLSKAYEASGNYVLALKYEKLNSEYQKKLYDQESYKTIQELQTRYEVTKKEEDIQRLTERNQFQERIRYLTLGILGITLLAAILGFLWFRRKRKSDADALKIAKLQQQEAELKAEMETAKLEEKEREFDVLASGMEMRQIKSYLDGLEAERTRLAGELHDNVSNALLGVKFKMQTPGVSQEEISSMLQGIHEHVRNISHELMPPVFQHATLAEIIADYVYMQNDMNGLHFECHIEPEDGWEGLPQETALELHRITQEVCGNALKHAKAKNIRISLHREENRVILSISDDGRGMDTTVKKPGLGLQIIHDRTAKMNGIVEIQSEPEKGTTIKVVVDWRQIKNG